MRGYSLFRPNIRHTLAGAVAFYALNRLQATVEGSNVDDVVALLSALMPQLVP